MFLAISSLLFALALWATSNTIRSVRFSDSGRSLTAYIQKQYDDIINGFNQRDPSVSCAGGVVSASPAQTPGTSSCLLMGKLIVWRQGASSLTIYNIVGTEPAGADYSRSDEQLITSFAPQALLTIDATTYNVPWSAFLSGTKRLADNAAISGLALIRSPKANRILSYTYAAPPVLDPNLTPVVSAPANLLKTTNFCIKNADGLGSPAKIVIGTGTNQNAVQIVFDSSDGECNGV